MSEDMKRELNGVKAEVGKVNGRLDHVQGRLDGVEGRLDNVQGQLENVQGRLDHVESDLHEIKDLLKTSFRSFAASLTSANARLADLTEYVHDKLVTRVEFHDRMDGFAGKVDDMRYDWAKHHARLNDHDKRLTRLEGRRA